MSLEVADALPTAEDTVIRVRWNWNAHPVCDEWEGDRLILTGDLWYLVEGISNVRPAKLAATIDSFEVLSAPVGKVLSEVVAAGGYPVVTSDGRAPWLITAEDVQSVAERYGAKLT